MMKIFRKKILLIKYFFIRFGPRTIKIRAGEWDTQTIKERLPYQERVVTRIVSHPDYSSRSLANDVVSWFSFIFI